MTEYFLADSLKQLRREIDQRWPNRDKASDGWIGDASHQARPSDHNPDWDAPGDRRGVVRAIDVDKDGISMAEVLAAVVRDRRVAYIIWNRRIASATEDGTPWDWEPYSGTNPHDKHIHISIKHTHAAETDTSGWLGVTPPPGEDDDMTPKQEAVLNAIYEQTRGNARLMVSLSNNLVALIKRELEDDADAERDREQLKAHAARVEELLAQDPR
jgi:hypothetical protein